MLWPPTSATQKISETFLVLLFVQCNQQNMFFMTVLVPLFGVCASCCSQSFPVCTRAPHVNTYSKQSPVTDRSVALGQQQETQLLNLSLLLKQEHLHCRVTYVHCTLNVMLASLQCCSSSGTAMMTVSSQCPLTCQHQLLISILTAGYGVLAGASPCSVWSCTAAWAVVTEKVPYEQV